MAILPLQLPRNEIDSRYDLYTPLAALGQQWAKNRDEEEAAKLVAGLFAQQQAQDAAAQSAALPPQRQAAPPQQQPAPPPPGPLPPLQPSPVSTPRGLTRFGDAEAVPPGQRIAAGHEALTQDPAQRVEGGFEDLRRVIVDTPRAPVQAQGFAPEEPAAAAPAAADPMARANRAISSIESGGDYQKLGPITRTGDRAYGKYQVMGKNVPDWTEKFFGQRLTPQQFVANPAAQDAVFNGQFGEYTQKYGPEGAAKAWFAGPRGMNNPNARDILGTSVSSYADKFNRNFGAGLPPEITSGTSKPQAPEGLPASQAMAFDKVTSNLANPRAPAGTASGISSAQIAALYKNPMTRPIATAYLQKALSPEKYDFHVDADNIVRYNKATGAVDVTRLPGKPQVVTEGASLVSPTGQVLYGGGDAAKYGKLPANYRWKDSNKKELGVEPIPDSEATKTEADVAGRIGLGKSYLEEVGAIRQRIQEGQLGVENTRNHLLGLGGLGKPGELRRKIDSGADALIRMLTGAGKPLEEARDYARRYQLSKLDTQESLLSKTDQLTRELTYVGSEIGKGRGGFKLEGGQLLTPDGRLIYNLSTGSAPAGGAPQKLTQEQYKAAPSGTQYLDPNGVLRTKR